MKKDKRLVVVVVEGREKEQARGGWRRAQGPLCISSERKTQQAGLPDNKTTRGEGMGRGKEKALDE